MAFVVEDGSGLSTSNGYITVDFLKAYHKDRGNDLPTSGVSNSSAIVRASDYMDRRWVFKGERQQVDQAMDWPRNDAFYDDGRQATGVPVEVKEACAEYALVALTSQLDPSPSYDSSGRVLIRSAEQVGPLRESKTFDDAGRVIKVRSYPSADGKLRELVMSGRRVERV